MRLVRTPSPHAPQTPPLLSRSPQMGVAHDVDVLTQVFNHSVGVGNAKQERPPGIEPRMASFRRMLSGHGQAAFASMSCSSEDEEERPLSAALPSLFEKIGGEAAVISAVHLFYDKVLADERVAFFFEGIPMIQQKNKQKLFLTMILDGPNDYVGRGINKVHRPLVESMGLNESHFRFVAEHLKTTFLELGVDAAECDSVMTRVKSWEDCILYRGEWA